MSLNFVGDPFLGDPMEPIEEQSEEERQSGASRGHSPRESDAATGGQEGPSPAAPTKKTTPKGKELDEDASGKDVDHLQRQNEEERQQERNQLVDSWSGSGSLSQIGKGSSSSVASSAMSRSRQDSENVPLLQKSGGTRRETVGGTRESAMGTGSGRGGTSADAQHGADDGPREDTEKKCCGCCPWQ